MVYEVLKQNKRTRDKYEHDSGLEDDIENFNLKKSTSVNNEKNPAGSDKESENERRKHGGDKEIKEDKSSSEPN